MKLTRRQIIKLITESIKDDSKEDVKKLMDLYHQALDMFANADGDAAEGALQQAFELANMSGYSRHPDWKVWYIYNGENGEILIEGLNYNQATDLRYLALAMSDINWMPTENQYDIYNRYVSHNPPSEQQLDQAYNEMIKKGFPNGPKIVEIDDTHGSVEIWYTEDPKFEHPDYGV